MNVQFVKDEALSHLFGLKYLFEIKNDINNQKWS